MRPGNGSGFDLIRAAEARLGSLSEADRGLLARVVSREEADFTECLDRPVIRAALIEWLCTDDAAGSAVPCSGLVITSVAIDGDLDLTGATVGFRLGLFSCDAHAILLSDTRLRTVCFDGTHAEGIWAGRARVDGSLLIRAVPDGKRRAEIRQGLSLQRAMISGDLDCEGAMFSASDGMAIELERAEIGGSVFLRSRDTGEAAGSFYAGGTVSLRDAKVGGVLDCTGAVVGARSGVALELERAEIGGSVFLRSRPEDPGTGEAAGSFFAEGTVSLRDAKVGGALVCNDALLVAPPKPDSWGERLALDGRGISAARVHLDGFRATGFVTLYGASIRDWLTCDGAQFPGREESDEPDEYDSQKLEHGFEAFGATVGAALVWTNVFLGDQAAVNLAFASVGTLAYDADSWPSPGRVNVSGLRYNALDRALSDDEKRTGIGHADVADFLGVIRRQTRADEGAGYTPQPYEQLATVLRAQGNEREAQAVLMARTDDRLRRRSAAVRLVASLLKGTIGYGWRPLRVLVPVALMLALGTIVFGAGHARAGLSPARDDPQPFSAIAYAIDALTPVIDLGQESSWAIATSEVGWLVVYYWLHVSMGWLLSSFVVVGIARTVRQA
jgi:hypothetical protein